MFWPSILALRATVHALAGQPTRGLELIDEALDTVGEGDPTAADFAITRGDILQMVPGTEVAEIAATYSKALSGDAGLLARLRGATRLVMLRRSNETGDADVARLAELYGRFTEGFEEADVMAAAGVLDAEGAGPHPA